MKRSSYRDRDYAFGQAMLTLRTAIGLTQAGLADYLEVSRRAVGDWEAGSSYPKTPHLKQFITLAIRHQAFRAGHEAEEIRALWQAARQKVLLDEAWIASLLAARTTTPDTPAPVQRSPAPERLPERQPQRANGGTAVGLPFQPTPFVGRVAEIAEITRILGDPVCRLLTLLGPGGVGKTRLSLAVAAQQAPLYADGVAFVALASVSAPGDIVSAIGEALNLSYSGSADPTDHLLGYLRDRHLLLVLDNFEHLLAGVNLVYDILLRAPHVSMLVTSRARLNLQAEWLFDVEGLSFPSTDSPAAPSTLADLADYSAVQLFVQRATQIQPGLPLPATTLAALVNICRQVAGMPLAIELAAAAVREMPIAEIERQIRVNLDVLATTARDVPPRHRSLRAVFDHSWNLLNASEQALLSRLSVFRGGCTLAAAEQVAGGSLPALAALVDKSLLREIADSTVPPKPRYSQLEPIREYMLEKLAPRGEAEAIARAHAAYYLKLAEAAAAQWDTPTVDAAIDQLTREHNNLRAALQWAHDSGSATVGLQIAGALWRFWRGSGYINEGREWLASLLALNDDSTEPNALSARIRALNGAAWLASDQHDFARATQLFEQSRALRQSLGETEDETHLLLNAARQARAAGQYPRAVALLEDALARQRALGIRGSSGSAGRGLSYYELALALREQGEFARAAALYQECMDFHREIGDQEGTMSALLGLGDVARDTGDATSVREYTEPCLAFFQDLGIQWAIGFSLNNLAQAAYFDDDLPQAFALASQSVALFRSLRDDGGLAEVLVTLGQIMRQQGAMLAARDALVEALRLARIVGPRLLVAASLEALASVLVLTGDPVSAARYLSAAWALRAQLGTPVRPADQPVLDRASAAAQTALGANAFARIWSEAAQQPLETSLNAILDTEAVDDPPAAPALPVSAPPPIVETNVVFRAPRLDWNDALSIPTFYGREWELSLLSEWVVEERCRIISVLGLGGIGKSTLAVALMHQLADEFDIVIWRSLRDMPTCDVLLEDLIQTIAPQVPGEMPASLERRQSILLDHMRGLRILFVLDNLESVLEEGEVAGRLLSEFEGFGRFLRLTAETEHKSCLLLTTREKPLVLVPHEGSRAPVRALRLSRLGVDACEQLLAEKDIVGSASDRARLIEAYAGNPLSLKIVAQTIVDLFDGETAPFLEQGELIFGGVRELLNQQFARLSRLEQSVLLWLAILREPITLDELERVLVAPIPRVRLFEAVEALRRRSLIERGQSRGSFTLQSVVLEYVTARLVDEASAEIRAGELERLVEHGLELAHVHEFVRLAQERLILTPILANLRGSYARQAAVDDQLLALLAQFVSGEDFAPHYGAANLVTLLRLHRGSLRGVDLSRLSLRGLYLQGVDMQDASLAGSTIQDSLFTDTFDALNAVAVSPSGDYWAAGSRHGEIRIWTADDSTLRRMWRAHSDMIWALAFSPDGRALASGSWDGTVRLWDADTGVLRWSGNHASLAKWVTFSPDGRILASSGNDGAVHLWNARTGALLQTLPHSNPIPALAWSPDGHLLATGDREGLIRLWALSAAGQASLAQTLVGHVNWIDALVFSPDGRTLASVGWDRALRLWDLPAGTLREAWTWHTDWIIRVVWSPDGQLLATAGRDRTIALWNIAEGALVATLTGHTAIINGIAFTPDSQSLISCGDDGTLRQWDIVSGQSIRVIQGYADSLYSVDWSPDDSHLVSGGSDGRITIHTASGEVPPRLLHEHSGVVFGVGWSDDGRWLASSEWDNIVRLWNPVSGDEQGVLRHPHDAGNVFSSLAWSPTGQRLACGTHRRGVQVFDMAQQHPQHRWVSDLFPAWIRYVDWSPDGTLLAGGGDDGTIYIWSASDGALLRRLTGHHSMITSVVWSPLGALLASGGSGVTGGELFVWDMRRGERVFALEEHPGIVYAVAWGADDSTVISGSSDGLLRAWDVSTGECLWARQAHDGTLQALRRSHDGLKLASCGDDGAIRLWNLPDGGYLRTLRRERPYERLDITGIHGLNDAQKTTLLALGAVESGGEPAR